MRTRIQMTAVIALILLVAACASTEDEPSASTDDEPSASTDEPSASTDDTSEEGSSPSSSSGESSSASTDDALTDVYPADADADDAVSADSSDASDFSDGFGERNTSPFNSGKPVPPLDSRSPANISDVQFQVLESWPMQVIVVVSGDLPTPCHKLWWEVAVDEEDDKIYDMKIWGVDPPADTNCTTVTEPFTENVALGPGFINESYTVIVNGEEHSLDF